MAALKLWFRQELAKSVEDAEAELTVTMHELTQQSIHDAKARAQAAEKELQGLLAMNGNLTDEGTSTVNFASVGVVRRYHSLTPAEAILACQ